MLRLIHWIEGRLPKQPEGLCVAYEARIHRRCPDIVDNNFTSFPCVNDDDLDWGACEAGTIRDRWYINAWSALMSSVADRTNSARNSKKRGRDTAPDVHDILMVHLFDADVSLERETTFAFSKRAFTSQTGVLCVKKSVVCAHEIFHKILVNFGKPGSLYCPQSTALGVGVIEVWFVATKRISE